MADADNEFLRSIRRLDIPGHWDRDRIEQLLALDASEMSGWSKSDRLLVLHCLGWDLQTALQKHSVSNKTLAGFFRRLPDLFEVASSDSPRSPDAVYMFWDLALVGEPVFAPRGRRAAILPDILTALLTLRFNPRAPVRRSAEHGLYHLLQATGSDIRGRHP